MYLLKFMSYSGTGDGQSLMATVGNTIPSYRDYGDLWNYNLQKIEQIHQRIGESIRWLENDYTLFESRYDDLDRQLDILSSIYAGYNTITGLEDIMKLKAVLRDYRKRYTREGMDFDLVHSLMARIADARSESFESFPALSHDNPATAPEQRPEPTRRDYSGKKFKWVTFERNRSWFIVPYRDLIIRKNTGFPIVAVEEPDILHVEMDSRVIRARDIFIRSLDEPDAPDYFVQLNGDLTLAAGRPGREIFSDHDFISSMIKPYRKASANTLSPGRVRLFGRNHIFLYGS
jgi:hypothetical protein